MIRILGLKEKGDLMEHWVTQFMEEYGYLGIFLIMVLENLFPPIPSEVVLPFGGFIATSSELTIPLVIVAATLGSVVGAIILYGIGMVLNLERVEAIVDRWGFLIRIKRKDINKAFAWFDRYGIWTVFFGRMIPLIRSLISIPAGMARMNFMVFLIYTVLGSMIWNTLLVTIGASLGNSWSTITDLISVYANIIYAAIAIMGISVLVWLFRRRA
jgi:membrane protein DedA with SNARE-associated domain